MTPDEYGYANWRYEQLRDEARRHIRSVWLFGFGVGLIVGLLTMAWGYV